MQRACGFCVALGRKEWVEVDTLLSARIRVAWANMLHLVGRFLVHADVSHCLQGLNWHPAQGGERGHRLASRSGRVGMVNAIAGRWRDWECDSHERVQERAQVQRMDEHREECMCEGAQGV